MRIGSRVADAGGRVASMPQRIDDYIAKPQKPAPPDDGQKRTEPVQCGKCHGWLRAQRYSMSVWVVTHTQVTSEDLPDEGHWQYFCGACWAQKQGLDDEMQGILAIRQSQIRAPSKRSEQFREAVRNVQEEFPMVCVSSKAVKRLARTSFVNLFKPWAAVIAAERASARMTAELVSRHDNLRKSITEAMNNGKMDLIPGLLSECEKLEGEIIRSEVPQAFSQKPDQSDWLVACTYADEWVRSSVGFMRSYYLCKCGCCMSSKTWKRMKPDLAASKQRWYCRAMGCNRRFFTSFGQMVEVSMNGEHYWSLASIPPDRVEKIRARAIELSTAATSAQEVFNTMAQFRPMMSRGTDAIIRQASAADLQDPDSMTAEEIQHVWFLTPQGRQILEQAPLFNWQQVINFVENLED